MRSRKVCTSNVNQAAVKLIARAAAFVDFLKHFKSSSTEAADQLEGLRLNGDGEDDEYDMVDDSDDPAPAQVRNKSKLKYMNLLQDVANRERDEIVIDLNDVEAVSIGYTRTEHSLSRAVRARNRR
jgi:DNA replication licensing factor MCM7